MRNGTASGSSYAFTPEEAFKIEYGRITEPVSEVVMTGDIWAMLRSIKAVGSDFGWARGAGCAKSGQYLPTISWGGPHIILTNALIGEG
jgi:TldD protein